MNALTLLLLLGAFEPSPLDLLETSLLLEWSELPFMANGCGRILLDGDPVMLSGSSTPLPPWGSFDRVELLSPLESGIWGGGRWTTEFETARVPDSSYRSLVGLLENTVGRNRYICLLQRPIPLGMGFSAALGREDTVSTQLLRLERGPFSLGGFFWESEEDGYSAHASFRGRDLRASAVLASPEEGTKSGEGRITAGVRTGLLLVEAAAGAASWDSLELVEGHVRSSFELGPTSLVARGDFERDSGGVDAAGTAGLICRIPGGPGLGLAFTGAPGCEHGFLATAAWGGGGAEFTTSDSETAAGAHLAWSSWLRISAFASDSLRRAAISAFPGIRYGARALISLGGRIEIVDPVSGDDDEGCEIETDLCTSFRLLGFSLVGSIEDVFDDANRRATYGIIWFFSDPPAWQPGEEEGER